MNFFYIYNDDGDAGERLTDPEVEQILKYTGTEEDLDGNIKYEGKRMVRFNKILLRCDCHILQFYLPDRPDVLYCLRKRHHNKTLSHKTVDLNVRDFLVCSLDKKTETLAQLCMYFYVFYVLCFELLHDLLFVFLTDCPFTCVSM